MRICTVALILFSVFHTLPAHAADPLCGLFKVEAFVREGVKGEVVLNPQAVSRTFVKISNPDLLKEYEGRVVKAQLWLKSECHRNCTGTIDKISGTVSPYETITAFTRGKDTLVKEQSCEKSNSK